MNEQGLLLIRVSKVTSNDDAPMVYLPKGAREKSGIERGDFVLIYVDGKGRIILEKFEPRGRGKIISVDKQSALDQQQEV